MALPLIPLALTAARVIARNKKARETLKKSVGNLFERRLAPRQNLVPQLRRGKKPISNGSINTPEILKAAAAFETGRQIEKARKKRER